MDFVHDALVDGRRFRILSVVDDYSRGSLCLAADTSLPVGRAIRELEAWRRDFNTERPHSSLGNLTPIAYAARIASVTQQAEVLRSIGGFAPRPGLEGFSGSLRSHLRRNSAASSALLRAIKETLVPPTDYRYPFMQ